MSDTPRKDRRGATPPEDATRTHAPTEVQQARSLILARRQRFLAAALAGVGAQAGCDVGPTVCLSFPPPPTTMPDAGVQDPDSGRSGQPPTACLSIEAPPPPPSSQDANVGDRFDAGAHDASAGDASTGDANTPEDAGAHDASAGDNADAGPDAALPDDADAEAP